MAYDNNPPNSAYFHRELLGSILDAKRGDTSEAESRAQALVSYLVQAPDARRGGRRRILQKLVEVYGLKVHIPEFVEPSHAPFDLTRYNTPALPGVSLVTCARNRTENLLRAMPSWLRHNEIKEIIVVDWSSDQSVNGAIRQAIGDDPRIKVIRAKGQSRWILTYAYNLGFRAASCKWLLKADADIVLSPDFFERNPIADRVFIAGDWRQAKEGQEHVNGLFYVNRDDLVAGGGFNEYITTYGWDDTELYDRLFRHGLQRRCVDMESVWHLDHGDDARLDGAIFESSSDTRTALDYIHLHPLHKIRINRFIANVMPPWDGSMPWLRFVVIERERDFMVVEQSGESKTRVPEVVANQAYEYATRELASWWFSKDAMSVEFPQLVSALKAAEPRELKERSLQRRNGRAPAWVSGDRKRIFIDAQHGLGNRLRAIASAACLAQETGRELVVIWQPDAHCECEFSDLFRYAGAVLNESFVDAVSDRDCVLFNYMESEPGSEKDAPIQVPRLKDVYIRSAYVLKNNATNWEKENEFLRSLQPVEAVSELVNSVRNPNDVSAHVRMIGGTGYEHLAYESADNWTDEGHREIDFWRKRSHYSNFLRRIDQLASAGRAEQIFVAADNADAYSELQSYYGDRMAFLPRECFDRSREQLQYALADTMLLGRANLLLGSNWSSFSELALRLASGRMCVEMSGTDF